MEKQLLALWRCVHCESITIVDESAPQEHPWSECECGAEFYPISRQVLLGRAIPLRKVAGEPLEHLIKNNEPEVTE